MARRKAGQSFTLKTSDEIELMRRAGRLVAMAHQRIAGMIRPGVSTGELDVAVDRLFADHGAEPLFKGVPGPTPFPAATCISVEDELVHGIPGERRLRAGEIVSVDTGCRLNGWCADAAWTYPVGEVDELRRQLLNVGANVLNRAIGEMGRMARWSEIAAVMENIVETAGFSVVERFVGHGIGRELHESPQVPNSVTPALKRCDFELQPGLAIAIEPMVTAGTGDVRLLNDGWTVVSEDGQPNVHFEHTVALTSEGPVVITEGVGAT